MGSGVNAPPLPPFANVAGCWGLFGLGGTGIIGGDAVYCGNQDITASFLGTFPYQINWPGFVDALNNNGGPPAYADTIFDQNANANNLTASSTARPTLDAVNKLVAFGGIANGTRSANQLYVGGAIKGTIYIDFQPLNLTETSVIFETDTFASNGHMQQQISIRMVAGVLTASIFDLTPVVALPNTRIKTISATDRIFITFTFDLQEVPSTQTALYVNNSTSGVTLVPSPADLSGLAIGQGNLNIGARNNAASAFLTANMWNIKALSVVDDAAARLAEWDYNQFLRTQ